MCASEKANASPTLKNIEKFTPEDRKDSGLSQTPSGGHSYEGRSVHAL
jgi:hypothetical protein